MRRDVVGMPRYMQDVPDDCLSFNCEHRRCTCDHIECAHNENCTECPGTDFGGCVKFEAKS